jgi:hypothetical protein
MVTEIDPVSRYANIKRMPTASTAGILQLSQEIIPST